VVEKRALGAAGEPFVLEVERGKIREYARAIHSEHPAYFDDARPLAPAHFLTTTFLWEGQEGTPWPRVEMSRARGMHAEQEYVFHGPPPRAGDRLTCRSRIEDIYEKQGTRGGGLTFVIMTTEFRDDSGALVAEARMTAVETAAVPEKTAPEEG
jgi:N-terminal half of MaoC dehydratase